MSKDNEQELSIFGERSEEGEVIKSAESTDSAEANRIVDALHLMTATRVQVVEDAQIDGQSNSHAVSSSQGDNTDAGQPVSQIIKANPPKDNIFHIVSSRQTILAARGIGQPEEVIDDLKKKAA